MLVRLLPRRRVAGPPRRGLITADLAKIIPETSAQRAMRGAAEARSRAYRTACARDLWPQSHSAARTIVETYLWSWLLTLPVPSTIRRIGQQRHGESVSEWPAMMCRVNHLQHGFIAVHLTYLNPFDPTTRVDLDPRKRCVGPINGAAVQLSPAAPRMPVAEGIGNALAVIISWEMACWAAPSAGGIERLALLAAVVEVVIVGDRDRSDVSQCAALRAANMLYCRERV
jgi:hypothetical protein